MSSSASVNPTVRRRRLGAKLRELREERKLTAEDVAQQLLVSQSKISRLENGRRSISQRDVRDLCRVYSVTDEKLSHHMREVSVPVSRSQGSLLYLTARSIGAKRIVEFGTSFGISTIYLAAAVKDNGGGLVTGTENEPDKQGKAVWATPSGIKGKGSPRNARFSRNCSEITRAA